MGKFKEWIIENAVPQSGAKAGSNLEPIQPTQAAQTAVKIANDTVSSHKNEPEVQKITKDSLTGNISGVRSGITVLANKATQNFGQAPVGVKTVTKAISGALPIENNPFASMKTFMKKETAEIEEGKLVTNPYSFINDKPKSPNMGLPKTGTSMSYAKGVDKRNSMVKPINPSSIKKITSPIL